MVIRLAEFPDLAAVLENFRLSISDMQSRGIDQWDEQYPSQQLVAGDIASRSLWVADDNGVILASICLNDTQPAEYGRLPWRHTAGPALVVHRLCVRPDRQRRGLGWRLMKFAEELGRERGFASIRLEVYAGAPAALALYQRLGYVRAGQIRFPRRRMAFDCMELSLTGTTRAGQTRRSEPGAGALVADRPSVAPSH